MHLQMRKASVGFVLAGLLIAAGAARAQTARFDVPFQFKVGKVLMPAGAYIIQRANTYDTATEEMRGVDPHTSASNDYFIPSPVELRGRKDTTDLIFRCYSGECFLSQIWTAGNPIGKEVRLQVPESLLAREAPAPDEVEVAALR